MLDHCFNNAIILSTGNYYATIDNFAKDDIESINNRMSN